MSVSAVSFDPLAIPILLDLGGDEGDTYADDGGARMEKERPHLTLGISGVAPSLVPQPGVFEAAHFQPPLDLLQLRRVVADRLRPPVRNLQLLDAAAAAHFFTTARPIKFRQTLLNPDNFGVLQAMRAAFEKVD